MDGTTSDETLTRYLLGGLSEDEQRQLEDSYCVDDELFDQIVAIEDELIDAYVAGELASEDRAAFERQLVGNKRWREKLQFARAFEVAASGVPVTAATTGAPAPRWRHVLSDFFGGRGFGLKLVYVSLSFAVVVGCAWLLRENRRLRTELRQAQVQVQRQRQEIAQRPAPRPQQPPPEIARQAQAKVEPPRPKIPVLALLLTPTVRSAERGPGEQPSLPTLEIPPGGHVVRLRVQLEEDGYESYRATVLPVGGSQIWQTEWLKSRGKATSRSLAWSIPSEALTTDDYIVNLEGRLPDGQTEGAGAYSFRILKH